jgi:hypothetical protein
MTLAKRRIPGGTTLFRTARSTAFGGIASISIPTMLAALRRVA